MRVLNVTRKIKAVVTKEKVLKRCLHCNKLVDFKSSVCPSCGKDNSGKKNEN